jgi:FkbM family methyltransferase
MSETGQKKLKTATKYILQKILGFKTYLYLFALFVIVKIRWDDKEKDFFHFVNMLPEEGNVLDLGANIGVTSYHLATRRPQSTIYSFEPLTLNMEIFRRIKQRFRLANIHEFLLALGDENRTLKMVMPVIGHVPMHGLSHVLHKDITENNNGMTFDVDMVRLDDFPDLMSAQGRLTGIKMDVENFEYYVLKGAEALIKKHRPVIYTELWPNENRKKCINFLNKLGYSPFTLHKKELVPFGKEEHSNNNFFFIPDSLTD